MRACEIAVVAEMMRGAIVWRRVSEGKVEGIGD